MTDPAHDSAPTAILCATPEELTALRHRIHADACETFGPTEVWRGDHAGKPVVLARCGLGKVNAAAAATLMVGVFGASRLVFSGVAGGINPGLGVGSVLLADRLAIHDYGLVSGRAFTPTRSGVIPLGAPRLTELAPVPARVRVTLERLRDAVAGQIDGTVALGSIVTADYFLNCAHTRDELRAAFAADAIDMESGAVSQVAEAWGRPLYVIRTLSDLAGEDSHLTYPEMAAMAAHNSAACVLTLLGLLDR